MSDEKPPICILKPGAAFHGFVELVGPGRIDGRVEGEIVGLGPVWIGVSARVKARISAPEIVIAGEVAGAATASCRIELLSTARVAGDLNAPRLAMAEGCLLEGSCRTDSWPDRKNSEMP